MKQYTYELMQDNDPISPREWDNLGTFSFTNNRYLSSDKNALNIEDIKYLMLHNECIAVPIYAYIHSGITLSTAPFSCRFDSGLIGFCYVTRIKLLDESLENKTDIEIQKYLTNEVITYDQFLNGDVWGYTIKDHHGNEIESCYGFYGEDYCKNEVENIISSLLKPKTLELY
jgi:hypothetical protein